MIETLLLLPGLLCDARLWRQQIEGLAGRAACVVADVTQDDTVEAMAARALAGLPDRFSVAGLSMGGYVAFALLRAVPDRVSRLALFDTSARPDTPDQARQRRGLMDLARRGRFRGVTPRLLPRLLHPANLANADLAGMVMAMAGAVGQAGFLRQQSAILGRPDSRPDLPGIAVPTLIAVGSDDALTPPDHAAEMAAGIPGAQLQIIAGCGHLPPLEEPARVTNLLSEWLERPAGGAR
ncbi:MAG TPA: alpha/beta fold hydrolase [Acetobacteraceae bacterium]|nr:alpha/beta fold hydrolase [Acetobacteraceae bacterium]